MSDLYTELSNQSQTGDWDFHRVSVSLRDRALCDSARLTPQEFVALQEVFEKTEIYGSTKLHAILSNLHDFGKVLTCEQVEALLETVYTASLVDLTEENSYSLCEAFCWYLEEQSARKAMDKLSEKPELANAASYCIGQLSRGFYVKEQY